VARNDKQYKLVDKLLGIEVVFISGGLETKTEKYTERNKPVPENIAAKLASVRDQIEDLNTSYVQNR
jgi:hypothetical protein